MKRLALLLLISGLTLTACSSNSTGSATATSKAGSPTTRGTIGLSAPSSTTTTISTGTAGKAYLAAVEPANAQITIFAAKAQGWTSSTTDTQAETDATPVIAALQSLDTTLTDDEWPGSTTSDVHTLVGDIGALVGDLQGLASLSFLDSSPWTTTFERDTSSMGTAVALVRHDLGLPAPATS